MADFNWKPIPTVGPQPPPCHGSLKMFEPASQECRQCSFQNGCRDKVEAARRGALPVIGQNFYQPALPPLQPHQQAMRWQPPMQHVPAQQAQVTMVPQHQEYYGRLQDPIHFAIAANPVPMRPQLPGESFMERAFKNAILGFGELLFFEMAKMFRQMMLPPAKPVQQNRDQSQQHHQ
jgi:hypothetical protein